MQLNDALIESYERLRTSYCERRSLMFERSEFRGCPKRAAKASRRGGTEAWFDRFDRLTALRLSKGFAHHPESVEGKGW